MTDAQQSGRTEEVPSGWTEVPLGHLLEFRNGLNADKEAYGRGTRFINVLEVITRTHIKASDVPGRVAIGPTALRVYSVQRGDVLFNRTSETQDEVGLAAVYNDDEPVLFGGFVIRGRPEIDCGLDPFYLGYGLRAPAIRKQIVARGQGAIRANVGQAELRTVVVRLPSPPEQGAIATALSDADELLASLDRLIAKKRNLQQATMQQLLTGKGRLPGFSDEWATRAVEQMGEVLAGKALNANGPGTRQPYLRTANVLDGRIDLQDVLTMPFTGAEFERFRLKSGDVLLNEGQSLELVGRCSMYRGEHSDACGIQNQLVRFRARAGVSNAFAEHLFRFCQRTGVFAGIATQTTSVAHLGVLRFGRLRLLWPPTEAEQRAIAEVLSDMDAEITALEKRRDKARLLKEGMMQELLTGRIRLV